MRSKRMERLLRTDEDAWADFFDDAPIGLVVVAPQGAVLRANHAQLATLRRRRTEVLGRNISWFFADPHDAHRLLRQLRRTGAVRNYSTRLQCKDGSLVDVLVDAISRPKQPQAAHSGWFVRDISDHVALEHELVGLAEREQRRMGNELHDSLGNHLRGLHYLAALLHKSLAAETSSHQEDARRLSELLEEAAELARGLAHGLQPVPPVPSGLMHALQQLAARTQTFYQMDCRFKCGHRVFLKNEEAATHLYRIAQEALSNAMKHSHARRIQITLTENRRSVVLRVRDDGIGISRASTHRSGMGLAIMRHRAQVAHGWLVVGKHPSGGTEVLCSVPRRHGFSARR